MKEVETIVPLKEDEIVTVTGGSNTDPIWFDWRPDWWPRRPIGPDEDPISDAV